MKKSFILTFLFGLVLFFSACSGCTSKEEPVVTNSDTTIVVDKVVKEDFDSMFNKYGKEEFRFYETDILLKNFLDEENDGDIAELVNIYQVVTELDSTSFDTYVYKVQHFSNGTVLKDSVNGFWIENEPIILDEIKSIPKIEIKFEILKENNNQKYKICLNIFLPWEKFVSNKFGEKEFFDSYCTYHIIMTDNNKDNKIKFKKKSNQ